ncbi:MAG: DUF3536 domain-containing protein [Elusimicrobia bacterium]|nr:DUF3536 domain-containing protein [Elusimicrobiota bacterium]
MAERYVIFHGHFYQPPRNNPWLEDILRQESAAPYHDWNERIFYECYQPSSGARVINDSGYTVDIVNNFEYISFNFGPTLAEWLEKKFPDIWKDIVDGDRKSKKRLGWANAIACACSHTILPLDIPFLADVDIDWGLKVFEKTFGRRADAMWLPETAINEAIVNKLIDRNLKFVYLVPSQIQSANPINVKTKMDVSSGNIDPRYPYRIKTSRGEILAILAHKKISDEVAFENLLADSKTAADRIEGAFSEKTHHDQIITILCDGETFGHHQPFAERGLAHLLKYELPGRGIKVINGSYAVEKIPAAWEIRIKDGRVGEGTSWSCAHGLGRWKEDCGCGKENNNSTQAWRGPLREAFEFLAGKTIPLFKKMIKNRFNGNEVISDYALVLNDFSLIDEFISKHKKKELNFDEKKEILSVFEMLKYTLFSFTSCGWFWAEISGIEPVENMAFALRALEIYSRFSGEDIKESFLKILETAPSNIDRYKNGRCVWEQLVEPQKDSIYTYIGGVIAENLASESEKFKAIEKPNFRVFINRDEAIAEFFAKTTETKRVFRYKVSEPDFPFEIDLIENGTSEKRHFTIDNIFGEARYNIMVKFWINRIFKLKDTYTNLLDNYLEFENVYHCFCEPVKEIEPVIAKVLMFKLVEITRFHRDSEIPAVKSLVELVKENKLNLDGFYTRRILKESIERRLEKLRLGKFEKIDFLNILFDIYFFLPDRKKENLYHNTVFRAIIGNKTAVSKLNPETKKQIRTLCYTLRIDPDIVE